MEKKRKEIVGDRDEEGQTYNLASDEHIDQMIHNLETEKYQAEADEIKTRQAVPAAQPKSKPEPKSTKPLWAKTEKMVTEEEQREQEDLIEFAYELDYEKYVEDMEVRQALALIKDRVIEMRDAKSKPVAPALDEIQRHDYD